jgi:hypothetical protein
LQVLNLVPKFVAFQAMTLCSFRCVMVFMLF